MIGRFDYWEENGVFKISHSEMTKKELINFTEMIIDSVADELEISPVFLAMNLGIISERFPPDFYNSIEEKDEQNGSFDVEIKIGEKGIPLFCSPDSHFDPQSVYREGEQYAEWVEDDSTPYLVSSNELPFLDILDDNSLPYLSLQLNNKTYWTIAYGVFMSQIQSNRNLFDLRQSKGQKHFILNEIEGRLEEVVVISYELFSRKENEAKVGVLIRSNFPLSFPEDNSQHSLTLTRKNNEQSVVLSDLILARKNYGIFRLDAGHSIKREEVDDWHTFVERNRISLIDYNRPIMFMDD